MGSDTTSLKSLFSTPYLELPYKNCIRMCEIGAVHPEYELTFKDVPAVVGDRLVVYSRCDVTNKYKLPIKLAEIGRNLLPEKYKTGSPSDFMVACYKYLKDAPEVKADRTLVRYMEKIGKALDKLKEENLMQSKQKPNGVTKAHIPNKNKQLSILDDVHDDLVNFDYREALIYLIMNSSASYGPEVITPKSTEKAAEEMLLLYLMEKWGPVGLIDSDYIESVMVHALPLIMNEVSEEQMREAINLCKPDALKMWREVLNESV